MRNAGLDEAEAGIKIVGRNINNLRCADDTTLMVENKEELKSLLVKIKEEREKAGLKLSILKSRDITLQKKSLYSQSYGFSNSHVRI